MAPSAAHPPSIQSPAGEAATGEEVADFLAKLRARLRDGNGRRDVAKLYSEGFSHISARGRQRDRAAHLQAITTGERVAEAADLDARRIRSPNGWVAVVTGGAVLEPGTRAVRVTIVLTRAGQSWQIAATHVTGIAPLEHRPNDTTQR
jgi:hypothetical protein